LIQSNLIDITLAKFRDTREEIGVALRDGTVVKGRLSDFDSYIMLVDTGTTTVVYRHSVLNVSPAAAISAQPKSKPSPANQDTRPSGKPRQAPKKTQQRKPAERKPVLPAQDKDDFANPLAGQMERWLKSQKGGK